MELESIPVALPPWSVVVALIPCGRSLSTAASVCRAWHEAARRTTPFWTDRITAGMFVRSFTESARVSAARTAVVELLGRSFRGGSDYEHAAAQARTHASLLEKLVGVPPPCPFGSEHWRRCSSLHSRIKPLRWCCDWPAAHPLVLVAVLGVSLLSVLLPADDVVGLLVDPVPGEGGELPWERRLAVDEDVDGDDNEEDLRGNGRRPGRGTGGSAVGEHAGGFVEGDESEEKEREELGLGAGRTGEMSSDRSDHCRRRRQWAGVRRALVFLCGPDDPRSKIRGTSVCPPAAAGGVLEARGAEGPVGITERVTSDRGRGSSAARSSSADGPPSAGYSASVGGTVVVASSTVPRTEREPAGGNARTAASNYRPGYAAEAPLTLDFERYLCLLRWVARDVDVLRLLLSELGEIRSRDSFGCSRFTKPEQRRALVTLLALSRGDEEWVKEHNAVIALRMHS